VCVYVDLAIEHALHMRHIVACGLVGSYHFFFPHFLINGTIIDRSYWI